MSKLSNKDIEQINQITCDRVGIETLERYTGSNASLFQPYILLTNFSHYVDFFSNRFDEKIYRGTSMVSCHSKSHQLSIINIGIGSPVAALIMELLYFIKPKATLMLGLCGGLRDDYKVGDFFNPVAAIREEGTSLAYMPARCPSLSSFVIQRYVSEELERNKVRYHSGVIHTTNVRFWEFKEHFKKQLELERSQTIDMECATLFTVGFMSYVPIGALLLISDLPLKKKWIKKKASTASIMDKCTDLQINMGINVLQNMQTLDATDHGYQF